MQPLKHEGWYIETNGRDFRPYYIREIRKGFFKRRTVEKREYIWVYGGQCYDGSYEIPSTFDTLESTKIAIEDQNFKLNQKHNWKTINATTNNDMRQEG